MEDSDSRLLCTVTWGALMSRCAPYAAELAKAVNDTAIEEGRQQMINELKFDLLICSSTTTKDGTRDEKLKRRHAESISGTQQCCRRCWTACSEA